MKFSLLKNWLFILGGATMLLTSCEETENEPNITADNLKGMFVVCEGSFNKANGDITFYNNTTGATTKSLYASVNNVAVGDIVQAFDVVDTLGFIVVNNSQKVTVINMKTFKVVKTITGFSYPRSVVRANDNTVYVANGNGYTGNYIYSIDIATLAKKDSIKVTTGPDKLIKINSKVYAAISGGWNNDGKSVVEIDPNTFKITNTYETASVPIDITYDKNNNLWVYCKGKAVYDANNNATYLNSGISKIELTTQKVTTLPLTTMRTSGINNIAMSKDGSVVYYLNDGVYAMPITNSALPTTKLVDHLYYGLDVDPQNGNIVCLDDVTSNAVVYNTNGVKQMEFETATFPNSVVFSY